MKNVAVLVLLAVIFAVVLAVSCLTILGATRLLLVILPALDVVAAHITVAASLVIALLVLMNFLRLFSGAKRDDVESDELDEGDELVDHELPPLSRRARRQITRILKNERERE